MINKAELDIQTRLIKEVADLRRDLNSLKSAQLLGGDNLVTDFVDAELTFTGVVSGDFRTQVINFFNDSFHDYYQSELGLSIFVDTDNDPTHHWSNGSALTTIPVTWPLQVQCQYDPYLCDEVGSGRKTYTLFLVNNSGNTRTYYVHLRLLFPGGTVT